MSLLLNSLLFTPPSPSIDHPDDQPWLDHSSLVQVPQNQPCASNHWINQKYLRRPEAGPRPAVWGRLRALLGEPHRRPAQQRGDGCFPLLDSFFSFCALLCLAPWAPVQTPLLFQTAKTTWHLVQQRPCKELTMCSVVEITAPKKHTQKNDGSTACLRFSITS